MAVLRPFGLAYVLCGIIWGTSGSASQWWVLAVCLLLVTAFLIAFVRRHGL